jgi:hypothetical protein
MKCVLIGCLVLINVGLFSPLTNAQSGYPPPCFEAKQVKLDTNQTRRQILADFINDCVRNRYWINDKGIILLREYQNDQGKLCWLLLPCIDDRYKQNAPNRFASFNGDIIIIYDANSKGIPYETTGDKNSIRCLEQIVGDRVYSYPTIHSRWTDMVLPFTNRKLKEGARRISGGNGGSLIIIFNPDGSYQKLLPV